MVNFNLHGCCVTNVLLQNKTWPQLCFVVCWGSAEKYFFTQNKFNMIHILVIRHLHYRIYRTRWINDRTSSFFMTGVVAAGESNLFCDILHICRIMKRIVGNRYIYSNFMFSRTLSSENNCSSSLLNMIILHFKVGKTADFQSATILRHFVYFWVLGLPATRLSSMERRLYIFLQK